MHRVHVTCHERKPRARRKLPKKKTADLASFCASALSFSALAALAERGVWPSALRRVSSGCSRVLSEARHFCSCSGLLVSTTSLPVRAGIRMCDCH